MSRTATATLRTLARLDDAVTALAWGPDGSLMAGGADGSVLRIPAPHADAATRRSRSGPADVTLRSPGGSAVVAVVPSAGRWVHRDGTVGPALRDEASPPLLAAFGAAAALPGGAMAAGVDDGVLLVDASGVSTTTPVGGPVFALAAVGAAVVAGTARGMVWLRGHRVAERRGGPTVLCLAVRRSTVAGGDLGGTVAGGDLGGTVAGGDLGGTVRLVDVDADGMPVEGTERELRGYDDKVTHLAWGFHGVVLVVAAQDVVTAWRWDGADVGDRPATWVQGAAHVAALDAAGGCVVTGHHDGTVRCWDHPTRRSVRTATVGAPVTAVACHRDLPIVAVGDRDGAVSLVEP